MNRSPTCPPPAGPIEAVYEEGRLRPLKPLPLSEGDHVRLELRLVPGDAEAKLAALDSLLDACAEMTEQQWEVFEQASARRPFFRGEGSA